ncbi:MAG: uracil-DNA glycosylase family protein [Bacteriovoracaceae bacterium]
MEEIFKQKLTRMKNPPVPKTFSEALCPDSPYIVSKRPTAPQVSQVGFSEKTQVIESLERFAQEKVQETGSPIIKISGGEVIVKEAESWSGIGKVDSINDLKSQLTLENSTLDLVLNKRPGEVEILFVTEKFRAWSEFSPELKEGFINELLAGFPLKTAELFERMILAMKLKPSEVCLYPVETDDRDLSTEVMKIAAFLRPQIIVTLGARATQKILKGQDRLTVIHGQFFNRKIDDVGNFQIVPLFHPSIIETNQNMKKTAWSDMQKIMKHLKKL